MDRINVTNISTRMTTEDDKHLTPYDHTALSAVNTCPTWGVLRYGQHQRMPGDARALALEAGSAGHEVFAACRWFQFNSRNAKGNVGTLQSNALGTRLFGDERFKSMSDTLSEGATERTNLIQFCLESLYTSGYYDDPSDTRRTVSNIAESSIAWLDRYDLDKNPIWVRDINDPNTDIGVEIAFDITVTLEYEDVQKQQSVDVRYCGKLDGLHSSSRGIRVEEEKTGARLDDAWLAQWQLSHQITGYCVAASTFTKETVLNAVIRGMKIPLGRDIGMGIRQESVERNPLMIKKWAEWLLMTSEVMEAFKEHPLEAEMRTTSCNRYFRSCSFLPLCTCETVEEKEEILEMMVTDKWSPLDE